MRSHILTFWILSLKLWKPYTLGRDRQPELGCHHHLSEARASLVLHRQASYTKPGVVAHTCNIGIWEAEAEAVLVED